MAIGLLGRKVGMTQIYDETGRVIPVTVIQAGPCRVLQLKTVERDGYEAVQLGYQDKPRRLARRSERGHVARLSKKRSFDVPKAQCEPQRFVREFRGPLAEFLIPVGEERQPAAVGAEVRVGLLADVAKVDVVGVSKGRGYSGVMKRHNFSGQRASHGVKKVHRHAGGTGCSAWPSRVFKGRRMSGQYGNERVTARNLKVVRIDEENDLLLVMGAVPGPNGGEVIVRRTNYRG